MKTTMGRIEPIFILAGQSNMVGRCSATELPEEFQPSNNSNDVSFSICWNNDSNFGDGGHTSGGGKFHPLQCQPCTGLPVEQMDKLFGPEMGIATSLAPRLKELDIQRAHFIKFAMGSTNLHSNWNPSNTQKEGKPAEIGHYHNFIRFCKRALASLQEDSSSNRQLWGMYWLQGESDSSRAKDANAYLANFQNFIQTVRSDLDCQDLQVVVSPVVWSGKKVHVVNQALSDAGAGKVKYCTCIEPLDTTKFGIQGAEAGICAGHLTATGLCDVGMRMGNAMPLAPKSSSSTVKP